MNQKQHFTPSAPLRFRRWSRKGYAAFASLGRCVTIGKVCKSITERALTKQASPDTPCHTKQMETGRDDDTPAMPLSVIERLLTAILPQRAATRSVSCGHPYINSINRSRDALNAFWSSILNHEGYNGLQDAFNASLPIFSHTL